MQSVYKKSLHQFFLKVHPDFFSRNAAWQRANERSVAQLNELLEWGKSFKNGILRPPPAPNLKIAFHLKVEDDGSGGGEVQSTFLLPKPFHTSDAYKGVAERSINSFLRELLVKAQCLDREAGEASHSQDVAAERLETARRQLRPRGKETPVRTLMEETSESLSETWYRESIPAVDDLVEADLIFFSREISPKQCAFAITTLRDNLPRMRYNLWYEIPLLISQRYGVSTDMAGTISVPWDFNPDEFVEKILIERHDEIHVEHKKLTDLARRIEQEITSLCNSCDLDDVIISCPHVNSLEALSTLLDSVETLRLAGVEKLSIEISDFYGFRKNGVIIVPYNLTSKSLSDFLERCQADNSISRCREVFVIAKTMLQQTTNCLREFRSTVNPAGVDAFVTDCTYEQRMLWARELQAISGSLASYDWSEVTFLLGPLEIDWEKHTVSLPWNFDGGQFLKYVEQVHSGAKERRWDKLVEEEAERKRDADTEMMEKDGESDVLPPYYPASLPGQMGTSRQDAFMGRPGDYSSGAQREKGPHVPGTVSTHVAQQYVVTQGTEDALHTESPMASKTSFESDLEVAEHLDWEGFHRDPRKMGTESMQATEDQERAFLLMNKNRREKIMKELLEDYKEKKRGKKRPENQTFGDYLGITDPKQKLSGMRVFPKGTGPVKPPI